MPDANREKPKAPREAATEIAKPVLKWAGGKARLVPRIVARLPPQIETYYEPFVGGAAVFFALHSENRFRRAVLSDRNKELVDVYRALKKDVRSVIKALGRHTYAPDAFYSVRAEDPTSLDLYERAARTIYLNKTGYNGLYRVNRAGEFNVPFGRYTNPNICDEPRLERAAAALKKVKLEVADFQTACAEAKAGDAVYFDPPYVPLSRTSSFTAYHHLAFGDAEHRRLAEVFATLAGRGVRVTLSNSDTPMTRKLFKGFRVEQIEVARAINSKGEKRGKVSEILASA